MSAVVRCVVFDVDDTLYLERDYVRSGLRAVAAAVRDRWEAEGLFEAAWEDFLAGRRGDLLDRALAAVGVAPAPALVRELVERYRTHEPDIRLLPDAHGALCAARARGAVAVVTDGPAASQRAKVRALGLSRWADPVVLTAVCLPGRPKPHPAAFAWVQQAVGAAPAACTYVADNPLKDFAGPAALGWHTVRVRRPGSLHEHLPSGDDVEREVTTLADLGPRIRGASPRLLQVPPHVTDGAPR